LGPALSLHKAHKKCPRFREGIFSFIFGRSTEFRNSLSYRSPFFLFTDAHCLLSCGTVGFRSPALVLLVFSLVRY
jgi:hypothetical protein